MNLKYWRAESHYLICLAPGSCGYEVNMNVNPGSSWAAIVEAKRWATAPVVAELRIIEARWNTYTHNAA